MRIEAYTPEVICQSLGLPSFAADPSCTTAKEAVRVLLMPSFHPEVCLTIADGKSSVVSAREMIWRQFEPAPMITDKAAGEVPAESVAVLAAALLQTTQDVELSGIAIDGMPTEIRLFREGKVLLEVRENVGRKSVLASYVAQAISTVWSSIENAYCRNALAEAAEYAGVSLPRVQEPPRKPTIETLVLGPEEERTQLLEALRKHHDA